MEFSEASCDPPAIDAKLIVLSTSGFPFPEYVMVVRDHGPTMGPVEAFFKESIRRDAMIGAKIVHALQNASRYQSLVGCFWRRREGTHAPGKS